MNAFNPWSRLAVGVLSGCCISMAVGCSSADDDGSGEESDALSEDDSAYSSSACTIENFNSERCAVARFLLWSAAPDERKPILERGYSWVEQGLMYSKVKHHDGYRQDCSGFVTMAWGIMNGSLVTGSYAPYNDSLTYELGSVDELMPGDAINRYYAPADHRHIVLFVGWGNDEHTEFWAMEEMGTGKPAIMTVKPRSYFAGFRPIRLRDL